MSQEVYQDLEPVYDTNDYLYDWIFHFNIYTKLWNAVPRETYNEYLNNHEAEGIIRSSSFGTLLSLLHLTKGDIGKIDSAVKIVYE